MTSVKNERRNTFDTCMWLTPKGILKRLLYIHPYATPCLPVSGDLSNQLHEESRINVVE